MTRRALLGWSAWVGAWTVGLGIAFAYYNHRAHDPAFVAQAKAQQIEAKAAVDTTMAWEGCFDDKEAAIDDGVKDPGVIAQAVIAQCGPFPLSSPAACKGRAACISALHDIAVKAVRESVLQARYDRAKTQADAAQETVRAAADALSKAQR